MKRQHGIAVLKYTKGNIWLLVLPLIRGLISLKFDFYYWIKDAYLDIIVILIVFGWAWVRWFFIRFEMREKEIYVRDGVLFRREFLLPYSVISCAAYHCPFFFKPFRAAKIFLDTDSHPRAESREKADVTLIISEIDYSQIYKNIPTAFSTPELSYRASKKDILVFSMLFSSTVPGIIYLGTFFVQGSRIIGEKMEMRFLSAVNDLTKSVKIFADGITPIAAALLMIIAGGWLISFTISLFRHIRFEISWRGKNITVENGYFSYWKYYVNSSRVNCADLRQNLLMKIAKIMSVHVSCTGYGKRKNELPVFVPVTTKKRVMSTMEMLLPDFTPSNILIKTKRSYIIAYIWLPLVLVFGVAAVTAVLCDVIYEWKDTVRFIGVMLEIPLMYLLVVKIVAKISTGIGVSRGALTVRYCRAYKFHTVIVPKGRVAYIKIRRTPFQRASGCCDVIVYTRGERVRGHRVKGVMFAEAEGLLRDYDKMC